MMKSYVVHSLFTAMTHLKYGIPNGQAEAVLGHAPIGKYYVDIEKAISKLLQLSEAHETQDEEGPFKEYVSACLSTTTKVMQRTIRSRFIKDALLNS